MTEYLSIHDAVVWAQEELGRSISEERIMNWLRDERISVHYSAEGELHGVVIHHPNGRLEAIKAPVPFNGILRAMTPPSNGGCLTASLVEVAFVRGKRFRHERQATVAGCDLPTTEEHGGAILPGYGVEAILDFASIPREDWLICIDELRALFEERGRVNDPTPKKGVLASSGLMDEAVPSSPIEPGAFGGRLWEVSGGQGGSQQPTGTTAESEPEVSCRSGVHGKQREPDAGDASAEASDDWQERARAIADELFDHDTKQRTRDSLDGYARRVTIKMQERGIHGPRGRFDNHNTIKREALQGSKWWARKPK